MTITNISRDRIQFEASADEVNDGNEQRHTQAAANAWADAATSYLEQNGGGEAKVGHGKDHRAFRIYGDESVAAEADAAGWKSVEEYVASELAAMEEDEMTIYQITRYNDGKAIGSVGLTAEQFARYESLAQQPEGIIIRLGAMPHDLYELDVEYQDTHEDALVYLD